MRHLDRESTPLPSLGDLCGLRAELLAAAAVLWRLLPEIERLRLTLPDLGLEDASSAQAPYVELAGSLAILGADSLRPAALDLEQAAAALALELAQAGAPW